MSTKRIQKVPDLDKKAKRWLELAPVEWNHALKRSAYRADWQELCRHLEQIAVQSAMLAEYIEARTGRDGSFIREHPEAVKAANRKLVRIRRALCFTYPASGTFTF